MTTIEIWQTTRRAKKGQKRPRVDIRFREWSKGRIVASGQGYNNLKDCLDAIHSRIRDFKNDRYTFKPLTGKLAQRLHEYLT
jgi:uncharacterized protein YegP (UPF0339 family)